MLTTDLSESSVWPTVLTICLPHHIASPVQSESLCKIIQIILQSLELLTKYLQERMQARRWKSADQLHNSQDQDNMRESWPVFFSSDSIKTKQYWKVEWQGSEARGFELGDERVVIWRRRWEVGISVPGTISWPAAPALAQLTGWRREWESRERRESWWTRHESVWS